MNWLTNLFKNQIKLIMHPHLLQFSPIYEVSDSRLFSSSWETTSTNEKWAVKASYDYDLSVGYSFPVLSFTSLHEETFYAVNPFVFIEAWLDGSLKFTSPYFILSLTSNITPVSLIPLDFELAFG